MNDLNKNFYFFKNFIYLYIDPPDSQESDKIANT